MTNVPNSRGLSVLCTGFLLCLMAAGAALAQITGASVVGVVTDPSGAFVAQARVAARNLRTNQKDNAVTNERGFYEFHLLPAGEYVLEIEHDGFRPAKSESFTLNSGTRPRIDLTLTLGTISQSVEVAAIAPLVNATTTDLGMVIDNRKIEALPLNGRNFQQLVGLQAGVLSAPATAVGGRGGIEFNGSPGYGNNLLLDGVDMTFGEDNAASGSEGGKPMINTVSIEALEEFKATGSAFSAEYGRATGGVLNLTTKSGTNQFHGTLFEFFRNDKLDANSFFSNRSGLTKPPLRWNQYGGNLGGPIRRDRIFFFFNYEGAKVRRNRQIIGNVPTPLLLQQVTPEIRANLDGLPKSYTPTSDPNLGLHRRNDIDTDDENTYLSRVDALMGRHRLSARHSFNHQDITQASLEVTNRLIYPQRFQNAALQDSFTLSPTMFNELRLGLNRNDLDRHSIGYAVRPDVTGLAVGSWGTTSGDLGRIWFTTTTYNISDNFSIVRNNHSLKFGFEIREVRSYRYQLNNPTHMYRDTPSLIADRPDTITVRFGGGKGMTDTNYGIFAQDEWRLSKRVQLNAGLRYEYYTALRGAYNITGGDPFGPYSSSRFDPMFNPDRNNFGPRLGIVWDALGNHRLVVRAGGGITYAPPQPFFYYNMSFVDPHLPYKTSVAPSDLPPSVSTRFPFSQAFIDQVAANPSLIIKGFALGRSAVDHNRRDEYSGQWNLSVQGAVTRSLGVQASYVGSKALKLLSILQVNPFLPGTTVRISRDNGEVLFWENAGRSSYHALQLSVNHKGYKGLTFDAYYTLSRTLSYFIPDSTFSGDVSVQDVFNIAGSAGPKDSDTHHNFVFVHSYQVPVAAAVAHSWLGRAFLSGWSVQGIWNWRSGLPFNVTSGKDFVGNGRPGPQRPDAVAGISPYIEDTARLVWLNAKAFDIQAPAREKRFGDLGYNALRGPTGLSFDGALHKSFQVREKQRLVFRFELFNALNHKILGNPVANASNPNFGLILSSTSGRNIQFSMKYLF